MKRSHKIRLQMSKEEADLVRGAIDLVRADIDEGRLTDAATARQALYTHSPRGVRDAVMLEFGEPEMGFMRDALDILEGKLP